MNYLKFMALLSILFLAACSTENEAAVEATETEAENTETEEQGPPYTEYMTCTPGTDFSDVTVAAMIDEWNDFEFAEGFWASAGHAPVQSASLGGENVVYWQLFWTTKEAAEAGWAEWANNAEADAWRAKHASVMQCDGQGRRAYDFYWPLVEDANWGGQTQWVTYGHYCKFNDEDGLELLRAAVGAFNEYTLTADNPEPFAYGVMFHNGENPEPFSNYDFFWQNYYENHADAETAYARFNENGSEIQAMFDASATCEGPNASDSYLFYPDPDDQV